MKNNFLTLLFSTAVILLAYVAFCAYNWYENSGELPYYGRKRTLQQR
jgi:hypothetical protein